MVKNINQYNCFQIDNNKNFSLTLYQNIQMISEGSCDTEDWSNGNQFSEVIYTLKNILQIVIILQYYCFYRIFV